MNFLVLSSQSLAFLHPSKKQKHLKPHSPALVRPGCRSSCLDDLLSCEVPLLSSPHSPVSLQLEDVYYISNVSEEVRRCSDKILIAMAFQNLIQVARQVTRQWGSVLAVQLLQLQADGIGSPGWGWGCRTRASLLEIPAPRSVSYIHAHSSAGFSELYRS